MLGSQGLDGIRTAHDRLIAKVMNLVSVWELILDLVDKQNEGGVKSPGPPNLIRICYYPNIIVSICYMYQ